ncbi:MAG: amidophosphoribosyltransferase, partial [Muribaculaceae bacterium]|nr:amidophosphoribosyltransferase [Muribaculaceae bacterium]
ALRDPHGIRGSFYYYDDDVVVLAGERPVIQTTFNVRRTTVQELAPGEALIVDKAGEISVDRILEEGDNQRCSFERIYFSRGSDADIYRERKELGHSLVPAIMDMIGGDFKNTVFSFIPNTAEVAYMGMVEGLGQQLDRRKTEQILELQNSGGLNPESLEKVMSQKLRLEKVALKDIKLRTFIAEGESRNDLAAHVYDVTYGCIRNNIDTLVVIDDSIVRGTTLRQSIIKILDRLHPRRIIIVSSSPQVRYPDYYGIDMSRMSEFIAFKAAIELLRRNGMSEVIDKVYHDCLAQLELPPGKQHNCVKEIYAPFSDEQISRQIADMLTGSDINAKVDILYQSIAGLHRACPGYPGDWYFSGNYPTPGGVRLVNKAYVDYYEKFLTETN